MKLIVKLAKTIFSYNTTVGEQSELIVRDKHILYYKRKTLQQW